MHLITMAHYGEAQGVIEKFKLKKVSSDLFQSEDMVLVITGEGPFEAATRTALTIPLYKFEAIINLGLAGSLKEELSIGEIVRVRTIYLIQDLKPQFKTFQSHHEGLDCLTSFERILDPKKAATLKGVGHLIDREAWGVAMAAKSAGIPFKSFKIISDRAGTSDACEAIKEVSQDLSYKLADFLSHELSLPEKNEDDFNLPGFHFTFSTQHKFRSLVQKLSIKNEKTAEETILSLVIDELKKMELPPKERTRRLIEKMEDRIDPTKKILLEKTDGMVTAFSRSGIKVQMDPNWENPKLTLSMEVSNDRELARKIDDLKNLSVAPYEKIMNGDI